LESEFGSSVVPTVGNIQLPIATLITDLLRESCTFTKVVSDEEEVRVLNFKSKIRGISALIDFIANGSSTDGDSIENKLFDISAKINSMEMNFIDRLLINQIDFKIICELLIHLCSTLGNGDDETPKSSPLAPVSNILDDRDIANVFDLVASVAQIFKQVFFRTRKYFNELVQEELVIFATKTISTIESSRSDILVAENLILESLDIISCLLKSVWCGKRSEKSIFFSPNDMAQFLNIYLKSIVKESIELCDNFGEGGAVDIAVTCLEIVDVLYRLFHNRDISTVDGCATVVADAMSSLTEKNICVPVACTLMESSFIVFGESENDSILAQVDWINVFSSIALFLSNSTAKSARNDKTDYVAGTIENIKAFIDYKKGTNP
jgi:hypothetical protein